MIRTSELFRSFCRTTFVLFAVLAVQEALWAQSDFNVAAPELRTKSGQTVSPVEFPPVDSEERYWACLVSTDPINRRGVLRWEQRDRMIEFTMLPYAPIFYRGAPACLADIPPGTMVEVWGYGDAQSSLPRHVLRMSDACSVQALSHRVYRVDSVEPSKRSFQATPASEDRSDTVPYGAKHTIGGSIESVVDSSPVTFSYNDQTNWYIGSRLGGPEDLEEGQMIRANFIRKFHEGPPLTTRCTEVWLDTESQDLATAKQLRSFKCYQRDRGFPLRVDAVDDAKKLVTVTLLETGWTDVHKEWKAETLHDLSASTTALRSWEPNGGQGGPDRMFGVLIKEISEAPFGYGSGGARMQLQVPRLYEAYRPGTIIKLYPNNHPVPILPIEERMPKEFDTFLR